LFRFHFVWSIELPHIANWHVHRKRELQGQKILKFFFPQVHVKILDYALFAEILNSKRAKYEIKAPEFDVEVKPNIESFQ
jgi:hypothetical protein